MYLKTHNAEHGAGPVVKILRGFRCHGEDCSSAYVALFYFCVFFSFLKYFKTGVDRALIPLTKHIQHLWEHTNPRWDIL